jgi:hypothetical protein
MRSRRAGPPSLVARELADGRRVEAAGERGREGEHVESGDPQDALAAGGAVGEPLDGGAEFGHLVFGGVGSYLSAGEEPQRGAGAAGGPAGVGLGKSLAETMTGSKVATLP